MMQRRAGRKGRTSAEEAMNHHHDDGDTPDGGFLMDMERMIGRRSLLAALGLGGAALKAAVSGKKVAAKKPAAKPAAKKPAAKPAAKKPAAKKK